jgi:hypothetical protein
MFEGVLTDIPEDFSRKYNVGPKLNVKWYLGSDGGRITFVDLSGMEISMNAIEFIEDVDFLGARFHELELAPRVH